MDAQNCAYQIIDRTGVATRWCGRRGVGHLPQETDKGYCSRLGFFHGLHLCTIANPEGVITGFAIGPASCKDQTQAEAIFGARHTQDARCSSVGSACRSGDYIADTGFTGQECHARWQQWFGVRVLSPPQNNQFTVPNAPPPAPKNRRRQPV